MNSMEHMVRKLYMDNDRPISMKSYISEILKHNAGNISLIFYNGDRDMTTNMVGTELVLNSLPLWGHGHGHDNDEKQQWLNAKRGLWYTNNYPSGWVKEYNNLIYAVVYNSGHMVSVIFVVRPLFLSLSLSLCVCVVLYKTNCFDSKRIIFSELFCVFRYRIINQNRHLIY